MEQTKQVKQTNITIRLTTNELNTIKENSESLGFKNVSDFIRVIAMNTKELNVVLNRLDK